jgi:hypothetical protein
MSLGVLILLIVVAAVVFACVPMDATLRNIAVAVIGIVALIVVLRYAGLL